MIAREGWFPIAATTVSAALVAYHFGATWSLPLWMLLGCLLFLFRDPDRAVPALPLAVVSPADGKVTLVEQIDDPWLDRKALKIQVEMRNLGFSPLRSPIEGKIMDLWTTPGPHRGVDAPPGSGGSMNCYALWIRTDEDDDVVFAVMSRRRFSRFKTDTAPGERVGQGQRNGFVSFGSRVDVLVPVNSQREARVGTDVLAGSGVIATLVHE